MRGGRRVELVVFYEIADGFARSAVTTGGDCRWNFTRKAWALREKELDFAPGVVNRLLPTTPRLSRGRVLKFKQTPNDPFDLAVKCMPLGDSQTFNLLRQILPIELLV
jgi:hypothetical protein